MLLVLAAGGCGEDGGSPATSALSDYSGPWKAAFRGPEAAYPSLDAFRLTPAARAAYEAFDPGAAPAYACIPPGPPWLFYYPYLIDIRQESDRIVFTHEYMDVTRTAVFEADYPDRPHGRQGFSVARLEGEALVVDTRSFEPDPAGLFDPLGDAVGKGIPSSAQKRVVTRYRLADAGERLVAEITVEDPVYLAAPVHLTRTWRRARGEEILPFDCVPDVARRPNERGRQGQ